MANKGQTKRSPVGYLRSVPFWTQFEGLVVTWDITIIYTISEMVSISILSILCIFEVYSIISGELTDEKFKIPAKKKKGLISLEAPGHGLNNRTNRDALLYRFLKTNLKQFLLNRTSSKLELDVTSENSKTVEPLRKLTEKFHIFPTPTRTSTKKPNHEHEFETQKVYTIEQNDHHDFSTPYDIVKSSMKKQNKQTQKNATTTEKLDLFFPSFDELEQNDFENQNYKYNYSTLVYDHTDEKTSSTESTNKVRETIYTSSSSSQLITSAPSTTSQPTLYTLIESKKAHYYKENAKRNYYNKFIKKLTYAELFEDQTTDNGVNKLNQIEFPLTSTMKAKTHEDETKSNDIFDYIKNYKNDYSGLVYDSVQKQTSSAELTDDFFEELDVVDRAYLDFNTDYDNLRKRKNIGIKPHPLIVTAFTTITPTRTNRFNKNKHDSMHQDYIKNSDQSIENRRKRRKMSKVSLNEALTNRRFKRGSNVIEEENIGTTVAGFKFTGRPSIYQHQLTFKNINT